MDGEARGYFARSRQPYAGGSIEITRRMTVATGVISALISLVLLAVVPAAEASGWAARAGAVALMLAIGLTARGERLGWNGLALAQCAGVGATGLLIWATGGSDSPQTSLLLVWIVVLAAAHPPRRAAVYLAGACLVALAPLAYDTGSAASASGLVLQLVLWLLMAGVANAWVVSIRRDRLQRIQSEETATTLARLDSLTELGNRRAFDEALTSLTARSRERAAPLTIILCDLDGLKQINDRFGHLNGDDCLRRVSRAMKTVLRESDFLYRWGGDEFAVLLPDCDRKSAIPVAERLVEAVAGQCRTPADAPLSITFGCAQLIDGMSSDELVAAADLALMTRKLEGYRDRTPVREPELL